MDKRFEGPRAVDTPQPGFFLTRLVKRGPLVPAEIRHVGGMWSAWIAGRPVGAAASDPVLADGVYRLWLSGQRIGREEHDRRLAQLAAARAADPNGPAAHITRRVDLTTINPLF